MKIVIIQSKIQRGWFGLINKEVVFEVIKYDCMGISEIEEVRLVNGDKFVIEEGKIKVFSHFGEEKGINNQY